METQFIERSEHDNIRSARFERMFYQSTQNRLRCCTMLTYLHNEQRIKLHLFFCRGDHLGLHQPTIGYVRSVVGTGKRTMLSSSSCCYQINLHFILLVLVFVSPLVADWRQFLIDVGRCSLSEDMGSRTWGKCIIHGTFN